MERFFTEPVKLLSGSTTRRSKCYCSELMQTYLENVVSEVQAFIKYLVFYRRYLSISTNQLFRSLSYRILEV